MFNSTWTVVVVVAVTLLSSGYFVVGVIGQTLSQQQQLRECECVDYWLCENGKIVTDGTNLLDVRQKSCPGVEVCCLRDDAGGGGQEGSTERPLDPSDRPLNPPDRPLDPLPPQQKTTQPPPVGRQPPPPTPPPPPPAEGSLTLPQVSPGGGCGRRRLPPGTEFKVTGLNGNPERTFYGEAPWMVVLLRQQDGLAVFACGGTLITPSVVLTAAHCLNGTNEGELMIRAGEFDNRVRSKPVPVQTRRVVRASAHPNFNLGNLQNDVALLFLESPVELNPVVDVVCGPEAGVEVNPKGCYVTGWGRNSSQGRYQPVLSRVSLELRDRDFCQNSLRNSRLGRFFILHEGFVCAGGGDSRDTCLGDGGGPLVCPSARDPSQLVQMGIVSWGIGCGEGYPTVFASVQFYFQWISAQLR